MSKTFQVKTRENTRLMNVTPEDFFLIFREIHQKQNISTHLESWNKVISKEKQKNDSTNYLASLYPCVIQKCDFFFWQHCQVAGSINL